MIYKIKIEKVNIDNLCCRIFYDFLYRNIHRGDGKPAIEYSDGYYAYYINGDHISHNWKKCNTK